LEFLQADGETKSASESAVKKSATDNEFESDDAESRELLISFCQGLMSTAEFRNLD
jgi:hypothetical protein